MRQGTVFKYGDNVDTDVIIPARYLNTQNPKELAAHCMEDIDKTFVTRVQPGDIMVGGENFGCGSSREHAPVAIKASGHLLRHRQQLCPHLLPQRHQHRPAHSGVPRRQRRLSGKATWSASTSTPASSPTRPPARPIEAAPFPPFIQKIIAAGGLMNSLKEKA